MSGKNNCRKARFNVFDKRRKKYRLEAIKVGDKGKAKQAGRFDG